MAAILTSCGTDHPQPGRRRRPGPHSGLLGPGGERLEAAPGAQAWRTAGPGRAGNGAEEDSAEVSAPSPRLPEPPVRAAGLGAKAKPRRGRRGPLVAAAPGPAPPLPESPCGGAGARRLKSVCSAAGSQTPGRRPLPGAREGPACRRRWESSAPEQDLSSLLGTWGRPQLERP